MKRNVFLILVIFFLVKITYACNSSISDFKNDDIAIWLGNKSVFSKAYKDGKCVLDKALLNIPVEQRKVIASLIAKSYANDLKVSKEVLTYNY